MKFELKFYLEDPGQRCLNTVFFILYLNKTVTYRVDKHKMGYFFTLKLNFTLKIKANQRSKQFPWV